MTSRARLLWPEPEQGSHPAVPAKFPRLLQQFHLASPGPRKSQDPQERKTAAAK
jgi:hypothetical protein